MSANRLRAVVLLRGGATAVAERLSESDAEIVVVADERLAGAVDQATVDALCASLDHHQGAAMVVGLVTDPETGEPWPVPAGLAVTGHPLPPTAPPTVVGPTFVPGALWAARRAVVERVGGLDADEPEPFASIDLAWRLWLAGPTVLLDPAVRVPGPRAVVPSPATGPDAVAAEVAALSLLDRNLRAHRREAALELATSLSPVRLRAADPTGDERAGITGYAEARPGLAAAHRSRQALRRRPDVEIVQHMGDLLAPDRDDPDFVAAHAAAVERTPGLDAFTHRWRIAVVTADSLTHQLAGPAIRAHRIAEELALHHEVRLVSLLKAEREHDRFEISLAPDMEAIEAVLDWCDVLLYQGPVLAGEPVLETTPVVTVIDIYDPFHLEQLEQSRDEGEAQRRNAVRQATALLNEQALRGDFFMCASRKQWDLWLGTLASVGRVNPATYDEDPSLESLLAVVPFGVSDEPPVRTGPGIRGVIDGVGPDDRVVLWGGGVYNWFDPLTVIRAVDRLKERLPDLRLVFLGMRHPNPTVPEMRVAGECRALAAELGLTGRHVFFNDGWVPFDERHNHFLDADVAVTTHFHHVETEYSFRTRVLDYLWTGLPTISTSGDSLSDLIAERGLGRVVPPEDVDALAAALEELLTDDAAAETCRRNIAELTEAMRWSVVLGPLVEFCAHPRRAPDLMEGYVDPEMGSPFMRPRSGRPTLGPLRRVRRDLSIVKRDLRTGGPGLVLRRLTARVRNVLARRRWV